MATRIILNVEGMDCPSCTRKIESAVCALSGVENVSLNYTTQKLKLDLPNSASESEVAKTIEKLGYKVNKSEVTKRWWETAKGRLTIATGAMLGVAASLSLILPQYADYLFIASALLALYPLARKSFNAALIGQPFTIETLVTLAVIGAIAIGEHAEAAIVVFLFLIGELLELLAAAKARGSIQSLAKLTPENAFLVKGNTLEQVSAATLHPNDIIEVRPGDRIAADGVIHTGSSSINEAAITGESMPQRKAENDSVFAGTINLDGVIRVTVTKSSDNNMINRILEMVEDAEASKAPTARFIDHFSTYYTPGVIVLAALVAFIPPLIGGADLTTWIYKGLAILLIGCPCALVLSTPAAITSGISAGARHGLLIKGGAILEAVGKVNTVAFDKTGTLTRGTPTVTNVITFNESKANMLALAASAEAGSSHPIAKAITSYASGLDIPASTDAQALNGRGVCAMVGSVKVIVASPRYAAEITGLNKEQSAQVEDLETDGKTVVVIVEDGVALGLIALRDELRSDAVSAIAALKSQGVSAVMLTGDNALTGNALAASLGIKAHTQLQPQDKLSLIKSMQKTGPVAMVGDGINDAPALAAADIGIAMGNGTDVALETADAALLHGRMSDVPALIDLSRATMANIYQNISLALGLKFIFLLTTLLGITSLWMAIMADTGATVLVTLNALRLLGYKAKH